MTCLGIVACQRQGLVSITSPKPQRHIVVSVEGQSYTLDAGVGCFWEGPHFNVSNTVAYLIRNKGTPSRGYNAISIAKVSETGVTDPVFRNADLPDRNSVTEITRVSDDGKSLLVELHYVTKREGHSTYFDTRPMILDIETGEMKEIEL